MESLHNETWIDFWRRKSVTVLFSPFPAEKIYKQYLLVLLQMPRFKTAYLLAFPAFLPYNFGFLPACIPAWATVILRMQNVFCFKAWFHVMISWLISSWVVIFYLWFLSKEESCQYGWKQLKYFWEKTMYNKILSQNIKVFLVFNRCCWGRLMSYHSVSMITV